jgi:galactokinase
MNTSELKRRFDQEFGRAPEGLVRAPGRVNLIGEHTDYNDGFVLPIAIERDTVGAWARRADRVARFASLDAEGTVSVDLDQPIEPGPPAWANYCRGVAAGLIAHGALKSGADLLLSTEVPIGGGLSSSASLEVATALAMMGDAPTVQGYDLALLCQKAEHEYAGMPCGIMDQAISVLGRRGHALLLDCRDGTTRQVPFDDPDLVLLVADTQVKHELTDGGYAARREQCHAAARTLGVPALRDTDAASVARSGETGQLTGKEFLRARHVVTEIDRTTRAVAALDAGNYAEFGDLMYGSHASLRDDYEVSCEELDAIVELARGRDGVYGARMTGGGFGGCAIILAEKNQADDITATVQSGFAERFGRACPIFATRAAAGAGEVE